MTKLDENYMFILSFNVNAHVISTLINFVDSCHDSAKQTSLMALAAPRVYH